MKIDELNNRHLIADEGKVLRRIADNWVAGKEIYLGYAYKINGEVLNKPLLELPEHYEEISELETMTDEDFNEIVPEPAVMLLSEGSQIEELLPIPEEPKQSTLADLLVNALNEIEALKKEVAELKSK